MFSGRTFRKVSGPICFIPHHFLSLESYSALCMKIEKIYIV